MELLYGLRVEAEIEVIPAEHRAELAHDGLLSSYTAHCPCGWVGLEEKSKLTAMKRYEAHLQEEQE